MSRNRKVILAARPSGIAQAEHFAIIEREDPPLAPDELLVANLYLSVEPAMRGWIADSGNYADQIAIGDTMRSLAVGRVLTSRSSSYLPGDLVCGWFGWQEQAVVSSSAVIRKVLENGLSPSLSLGILGINGVTAYLAMTGIGKPEPGETVVVSTAAGSVGSAAGQIAKILGARTVGIAGGAKKVRQCIETFQYDAAIDYHEARLGDALDVACPDGIDVYYDNVAGEISDTVFPRLRVRSRIVVCGTASVAHWDPWPRGPRLERHILVKRARMEGFVIFDHMHRWNEAVQKLTTWIEDGRLSYVEDIVEGLEACPDAIAGLYRGENKGKRIIKI